VTTNRLPHVAVFIAMSLDGYIARPDGGLDWLSRFEGEEHGYQDFFASIDALVVGRNTYDIVLGFAEWPYAGKRCVILTHRAAPARHGEEFHDGPARPLIERLGREGVKRVYVDGGVVIREFLRQRLIDEMTISVIPIVLGAGIPLFAGTEAERLLKLESTRSWPSGLVQLRYTVQA
jgi:dihydrofolate reductase